MAHVGPTRVDSHLDERDRSRCDDGGARAGALSAFAPRRAQKPNTRARLDSHTCERRGACDVYSILRGSCVCAVANDAVGMRINNGRLIITKILPLQLLMNSVGELHFAAVEPVSPETRSGE